MNKLILAVVLFYAIMVLIIVLKQGASMGLLAELFCVSLSDMEPYEIRALFQSECEFDLIAAALEQFDEAEQEKIRQRHDIPADVRILLEKYHIIIEELTETVMLAIEDDLGEN